MEFDRITTRGGDRGESSLYDGQRRRKDDLVFDTLGDMDELFSYLGVVRASGIPDPWKKRLEEVQQDLLVLGGVIAMPSGVPEGRRLITRQDVERLEKWEKELMDQMELTGGFVTPGKTLPAAHTHVARTLARRLERRLVTNIRERGQAALIPGQNYVNRLSDLLYVMALRWEEGEQASLL
ncbi:MAG: cob(I)yrinic acid a,c-diamide adenosyltransferase [Spirochaetales bacterium]|nr:cob(I)yrinic acid a,c-diamide adenosyltransferase [Spirochaetales bacterium]